MTAEIILQHGWGHDASCWNGWQRLFETESSFYVAVKTPDRGYFRKPAFRGVWDAGNGKDTVSCFGDGYELPTSEAGCRFRILITHSFGLHIIPSAWFATADLLVIFGGFLHFHPEEATLQVRSQRILKQMCNRFEQAPPEVLLDFHAKSGSPTELIESIRLLATEAQTDLLLSDLNQLNESTLNVDMIAQCPNIAIFHGTKDSIVPIEQARCLYRSLPQSQLFVRAEETHALPFTQTEQCFKDVCELLDRMVFVQ